MVTIEHEIIIEKSRDACWNTLRDLTQAQHYVPGVTDTQITTTQTEGVGASRRVILENDPDGMDETVTDWRDGYGFTIRIHKGDGPAIPIFKSFEFDYAIDEAGLQTRFHPSMRYETKYGPLGALMSALFIKRTMRKTLAVICQSMKEYYETGEPTTEARIKAIRAGQ